MGSIPVRVTKQKQAQHGCACFCFVIFHESGPSFFACEKGMSAATPINILLKVYPQTGIRFWLLRLPVSGFRNRTRKRNQALKESFRETIRLKVFSYLLSLQKYPVRTNWNRSPTLAFFREGSALACSAVIRESGFR